jgi:hypothetical protein
MERLASVNLCCHSWLEPEVAGEMRPCVLCCAKIELGYVRATQTRLIYCDAHCFAGHDEMASLVIERCARKVS